MRMTKYLHIITLTIFITILYISNLYAQKDSAEVENLGFITIDTTNTFVPVEEISEQLEIDTTHTKSPKKAALYSAIFPGLGQIYNGKYWKVPIVWGAVGGSVYFSYYIFNQYYMYLNDYVAIKKDTQATTVSGIQDENKLLEAKNQFRKYRDYSVLACILFYGFNIIDANIDAHFANFDVSEDLSLNFSPKIINLYDKNYTFGINLALSF